LHVLKLIGIRFMGKEVSCMALFDAGSGYSIVRRGFFEKSFGANWLRLSKPIRLYLVDGRFIDVDKYALITIVIDGVELLPPETVLVADEFVEEIEVEGRKIVLPDVIIGSGTMDKYGIVLDPREGVKLAGASLLI